MYYVQYENNHYVWHIRSIPRRPFANTNGARSMGDRLVVGVSSDSFNFENKQRSPIIPCESRINIVRSLKCVDDVFIEEAMDKKQYYIDKYNASTLVMGDDWSGMFEMVGCDTIYIPRTAGISTTSIIHKIREDSHAIF